MSHGTMMIPGRDGLMIIDWGESEKQADWMSANVVEIEDLSEGTKCCCRVLLNSGMAFDTTADYIGDTPYDSASFMTCAVPKSLGAAYAAHVEAQGIR